tara:strand:- start:353 stop:553 length:201 start_codon:yes stop_codon:yes gene_type:complete
MSDDILKPSLAVLVVLAFCGAAWMLFVEELPAGNRDFLAIMLGVIASSLKEVLGFYFGSASKSNGS